MKVIAITGTTATGKTAYAIELAKKFDAEILNCDARQIYKYLDIVTGKDISHNSKFNKRYSINKFDIGYYIVDGVKIWLYDILSPKLPFSSFDYFKYANFLLEKFLKDHKNIIIVGGTYLYLKTLVYGLPEVKTPPDWNLRKKLESKSVEYLQKKLQDLNSAIFMQLNNSDKQNPQRLIRKIEVAIDKPQSLKSHDTNQIPLQRFDKSIDFEFVGLKFKNKEFLRKKIQKRVLERLKNGAVHEVKKLMDSGFSQNDPGLKTIGYQQIFSFLQGKINQDTMILEWQTRETQYAKRQLTFMKKDRNIEWTEI